MAKITLRGEFIARTEDEYTRFIFNNLEFTNNLDKYYTILRLPNWGTPNPPLNTEGFVTFDAVSSGEPYIDRLTGNVRYYTNSCNYFMEFTPIKERATTTFKL